MKQMIVRVDCVNGKTYEFVPYLDYSKIVDGEDEKEALVHIIDAVQSQDNTWIGCVDGSFVGFRSKHVIHVEAFFTEV